MIKLKEFLKCVPPTTLMEIHYIRKNKPTIVEMGVVDDIKFRNQYTLERIIADTDILIIYVRERKRK